MSHITLKPSQEKAVKSVGKYISIIDDDNSQPIVLHAPTGSGKTVMLSEIISRHLENYATIVLSPGFGNLEEQTLCALQDYLSESSVTVSELTLESFASPSSPGSVYVKNWESLATRDKSTQEFSTILTRSSEKKNFFDWIAETVSTGTQIALIIDEAHYGAKKTATSIRSFMETVESTIASAGGHKPLRIEASATPMLSPNGSFITRLSYKEAVKDELVRESVLINKDISTDGKSDIDAEIALLDAALDKQKELATIYDFAEDNDERTIPLIAVQIPNSTLGKECRERVKRHLQTKGLTISGGEVAEYFSETKSSNMDGIARLDSPVRVMLYKQGIATGWNCPRAQILVAFRHIKSVPFSTQNIGRFLRTTHGKIYRSVPGAPYDAGMLNYAYVYTNKDFSEINTDREELLDSEGIPSSVVIPLRKTFGDDRDVITKAFDTLNSYNLPQSTVIRNKPDSQFIIQLRRDVRNVIDTFIDDIKPREISSDSIVSGELHTKDLDNKHSAKVSVNSSSVSVTKASTVIKEEYNSLISHLVGENIVNKYGKSVSSTISEVIEQSYSSHHGISLNQARFTLLSNDVRSKVKDMIASVTSLDELDTNDDVIEGEKSTIHITQGFTMPLSIIVKSGNSVNRYAEYSLYAQLNDQVFDAPHSTAFDSIPEEKFQDYIIDKYGRNSHNDDFELIAFHKFPGYDKNEGSFQLGVAINYIQDGVRKNARFFPDYLVFFRDKNNGKVFPMIVEIKGEKYRDDKEVLDAKITACRQYKEKTGMPMNVFMYSSDSFVDMDDKVTSFDDVVHASRDCVISHFDVNDDYDWMLTLGIDE